MRLRGGWVYHGWAEPGALCIMRVARRFDIAIGDGCWPAGRFWRGDGFLALTALAER
jgi:hypothetical protein